MPRIDTISNTGRDGQSYITVCVIEPEIDNRNLWAGGRFISFEINHVKGTTAAYEYKYYNGVPIGFDKMLKKWSDEILTAGECLKIASKF